MSNGFSQTQDGQIIIHTITDTQPETFAAWHTALHAIFDHKDPETPFFHIFDISHPDVGDSLGLREKVEALTKLIGPHRGAQALVLVTKQGEQIARIFMLAHRARLRCDVKLCNSLDEARAWLSEKQKAFGG